MPRSSDRLRYIAICTGIGLVLGWLPGLVHGPVPEKWDVHGVIGSRIVAAYVLARLSIGFWVGISLWPRAWYLRGPLCGGLAMLPLGTIGLANSLCGAPCMFWNVTTGATVGFATAGLAWALSSRDSAEGA